MPNDQPRAAIYARKSTEQAVSDDQRSVARQVERCRAFAQDRGWTVDESHVYVDDGISGAEFERRPGFLRLMNALSPRAPFGVLIMSEESRLGREAIETAYALKQLITAGVRVFFYLDGRERTIETATDKLLMSVTAFSDEIEREKARQRTYDAMARLAQAGHVTGGRVFGYDNVPVLGPDGRRSHVTRRINETEATAVRRIFSLTAQGYGRKRVTQALNADATPCPRPQLGRPAGWCPSSVHEALHRELYRGVIVWNASQKRDQWGRVRQRARTAEEWMRVEAPYLQIVSDALWSEAHAKLDARRAVYFARTGGRAFGHPISGVTPKYLLTGLAICGSCQGTLIVRTQPHGRRRAPRLACWHYHTRGPRGCGNRWEVPMAELEDLVLSAIERDVLADDVMEQAIDRAMSALLTPDDEALAARLAEQIAAVDAELQRLTALAAAGGSEIPVVLDALRARQAAREALVKRRRQNLAARVTDAEGLAGTLRDRMRDWRGLLRRQTADARQILEMLLDDRIVVTPCQDVAAVAASFDVRIAIGERHLLAQIGCPNGVASPTGFGSTRTVLCWRLAPAAA